MGTETAEVYKAGTTVPELLYTYTYEAKDVEPEMDLKAEIEALKDRIKVLEKK